jgi:hypothetical protein
VVWQGSAGDRRPYADQQPVSALILKAAANCGSLVKWRFINNYLVARAKSAWSLEQEGHGFMPCPRTREANLQVFTRADDGAEHQPDLRFLFRKATHFQAPAPLEEQQAPLEQTMSEPLGA